VHPFHGPAFESSEQSLVRPVGLDRICPIDIVRNLSGAQATSQKIASNLSRTGLSTFMYTASWKARSSSAE
jgi:hypothetical protein